MNVSECLDQLHSLHLVRVKSKAVQIAKIQTSLHPSPDLACAISEDPDILPEQIRWLLFKWHVHMVRVVRVSEQWMFRGLGSK